jgi:hypothetical protein
MSVNGYKLNNNNKLITLFSKDFKEKKNIDKQLLGKKHKLFHGLDEGFLGFILIDSYYNVSD